MKRVLLPISLTVLTTGAAAAQPLAQRYYEQEYAAIPQRERCGARETGGPPVWRRTAESAPVPVPVRVTAARCPSGDEDGWSYRFETPRQRTEGRLKMSAPPWVVLADVNFDGYADVWAMGFDAVGQGRYRSSEIWLYRPAQRAYVFSQAYSALMDLEVQPDARRLYTSLSNCGAAAACNWTAEYRVNRGRLQLTASYEQQPTDDAQRIAYRHYEHRGGRLQPVRQAETDSLPPPRARGRLIGYAAFALPVFSAR